MYGRTSVVSEIFKCDARKMCNKNWDGCRDLWKESYRKRKLFRLIDSPIVPPDPVLAEANRRHYERDQAYCDRFNRAQQKRYEAWLRRKNKKMLTGIDYTYHVDGAWDGSC